MFTFTRIFWVRNLYILIIVFLTPILTKSQNSIGLPEISNYSKYKYNAGIQNWDLQQDENGIMYFANNEGVLCFDGNNWNLYPLPNKTIVRSIKLGKDKLLYAGGQDEMGYFSPGKNGKLVYTSLINAIPATDRNFGDIWDIVEYNNDVFFRSNSKIFKLSKGIVTATKAISEWSFLGSCNNILYAHDFKNGLQYWNNGKWTEVNGSSGLFINDPVTGIISFDGQILVSTLKNGVYTYSNSLFSPLKSPILTQIIPERIYCCTAVGQKTMALGTSLGGIYILDINGNLIQRFSKKEGLQNNNILSLLADKQGNIWAGLDNGIDFIAYNSAIKQISPTDQENPGYASLIFQNKLFIGTSGGLYSAPLENLPDLSFSKGNFTPITGTTGQVWGLADINGQLMLGHHEGALVIENNQAVSMTPELGFWNFSATTPSSPTPLIIAGNYNGLRTFNWQNNRFTKGDSIPGFSESSRFVATDPQGNIWVSHPYHGIFKIGNYLTTSQKVKKYGIKNGLPSDFNNYIYKIRNQIVAATEKGVYAYQIETDKFIPDPFFQNIIGNTSVRVLKEDTEGNIWFIHEKFPAVIDLSAEKPKIIYLQELNNKLVSGFECIYPVNSNNVFLGGEKGFFHLNYDKYKKNAVTIPIRISAVRIYNQQDSTLFGGYYASIQDKPLQTNALIPDIHYDWHNIHIDFTSINYGQDAGIQYSYRLVGLDDAWSNWSDKREKEYTNLPPGHYSFELRAKNNLGSTSEIVSYQFNILPPWYRTIWAYTLYILLATWLVFYLYYRQRKKFKRQQIAYEEEQQKMQYMHQLEIDKAESELIALRNEKLQSEIDYKNSELAMSAMHLVQKGELITKLKNELNAVMKSVDNERAAVEIKKMIKVLGEDDKMDKDWDHFAQHFDKVHSDFLVLLKEKHPTLTPNEMKLCSYLRMNLSTKEMAQLMNISVRGVEISRYRLRKKLGIPTEMSIYDHLMRISGGGE